MDDLVDAKMMMMTTEEIYPVAFVVMSINEPKVWCTFHFIEDCGGFFA